MTTKIIEINSSKNVFFQECKKLLTSKGIKERGVFLLSGKKVINEFLLVSNPSYKLLAEIAPPGGEFFSEAKDKYRFAHQLFQEIDEVGTHFNILLLKSPSLKHECLEDLFEKQFSEGIYVFSSLSDPSNLGALLRSAKAFQAKKVILLKESAHPYLPKSVKASCGAVLKLELVLGPSIKEVKKYFEISSERLTKKQIERLPHLVVLDKNGDNMRDFLWPHTTFLLMGEEGTGLPKNLEKNMYHESSPFIHRIHIPMHDEVESLNAVVASSIALYSYNTKKSHQ